MDALPLDSCEETALRFSRALSEWQELARETGTASDQVDVYGEEVDKALTLYFKSLPNLSKKVSESTTGVCDVFIESVKESVDVALALQAETLKHLLSSRLHESLIKYQPVFEFNDKIKPFILNELAHALDTDALLKKYRTILVELVEKTLYTDSTLICNATCDHLSTMVGHSLKQQMFSLFYTIQTEIKKLTDIKTSIHNSKPPLNPSSNFVTEQKLEASSNDVHTSPEKTDRPMTKNAKLMENLSSLLVKPPLPIRRPSIDETIQKDDQQLPPVPLRTSAEYNSQPAQFQRTSSSFEGDAIGSAHLKNAHAHENHQERNAEVRDSNLVEEKKKRGVLKSLFGIKSKKKISKESDGDKQVSDSAHMNDNHQASSATSSRKQLNIKSAETNHLLHSKSELHDQVKVTGTISTRTLPLPTRGFPESQMSHSEFGDAHHSQNSSHKLDPAPDLVPRQMQAFSDIKISPKLSYPDQAQDTHFSNELSSPTSAQPQSQLQQNLNTDIYSEKPPRKSEESLIQPPTPIKPTRRPPPGGVALPGHNAISAMAIAGRNAATSHSKQPETQIKGSSVEQNPVEVTENTDNAVRSLPQPTPRKPAPATLPKPKSIQTQHSPQKEQFQNFENTPSQHPSPIHEHLEDPDISHETAQKNMIIEGYLNSAPLIIKKKENSTSGDDQAIEKNALAWLNANLSSHKIHIDDLYTHLDDGLNLIYAFEVHLFSE